MKTEEQLSKEQLQEVAAVINEEVTSVFGSTSEDIMEIKSNYKDVVDSIVKDKDQFKKDFEDVKDQIDSLGEKIKTSKENVVSGLGLKAIARSVVRSESFKKKLEYARENKNTTFSIDFENIFKGLNVYGEASDNGLTDVNIFGAVDNPTALDNLIDAWNADDVRGIDLRDSIIFKYITVLRTSKPFVQWLEYLPYNPNEATPANPLGYAVVKEGGLKPEQQLYATNSRVDNIKIAKTMMFTEEIWDDMPRIEQVVFKLLFEEFLLKRQDVILNYVDANNSNKQGIFNQAVLFDPFTIGEAVQDASLNDVIMACINQITLSENYEFSKSPTPNVCFLNPKDYTYGLVLKKDSQNNYQQMLLEETLRRNYNIDIVVDKMIPQGQILVCDASLFKVYEYKPYSTRIGLIDKQLIHNQFTIVAEGRHIQYLSTLDQNAFIYDEIATIKAELAAGPAPAPPINP